MSAEYDDMSFAFGPTYIYSVRSVSQFGAVSAESADSNLVIVPARDVFPPAMPQALVAVPVPVTAQTPAYIELTWSINAESDLAGYAVYRSDEAGAPGERLNPELVPTPAYRDLSAVAGRRYFYSVRAVDTSGNESPASAAVEAQLP